eukprot:scaffold32894_cov154-Skeletonema_menzelii.AAC.3
MVQDAVSMDATTIPKKVVCALNMVNNISSNHCKRPTRWHLLLHSFVLGIPTNRPRQQDEACCSITVKVPFTSLRYSPRKSDTTPTLLAALDYNGGVTILDSTNAVAFAEQRNKAVESDSSCHFLAFFPDKISRSRL